MESDYLKLLLKDVADRYKQKIAGCDGNDPFKINESKLSYISTDLPEIHYLDIAYYLIGKSSEYTQKSMKAYKGLEAYKYVESGKLLKLSIMQLPEKKIIIGKVRNFNFKMIL